MARKMRALDPEHRLYLAVRRAAKKKMHGGF
jgi:hypothetical protein